MEIFTSFLAIILYIVAIVLLVILIFVSLRFLRILDKIDGICDNIEEKVDSLNGAITIINRTANNLSSVSNSFVGGMTSIFSRFFKRKKKEDNYYG